MLYTCYDMNDETSSLFQLCGMRLWISCTHKDDSNPFVQRYLNERIDITANKRNINADLVGHLGGFRFAYMLAKQFGLHRAGSDQAERSGARGSDRELPARSPD